MSDYEPIYEPDEDPDNFQRVGQYDDDVEGEPEQEPAQPIEFPSYPIRADTDKPKKRRRKKTDQLDMFS